ncbi:MAG: sulfatase [Sphingomonadales bacterium]
MELTRRNVLALGAGGLAWPAVGRAHAARRPHNVLFICIDDLNDWVGCLDSAQPATRTPNIDRLAEAGTLFRRAYTPVPACKPAREAVLRALHPARTGVYTNEDTVPRWLRRRASIPSLFRAAGYRSLGGGKMFHGKFYYAGLNTLGQRSAPWQEEYEQQADWDEFHHFEYECLPTPWPAAGIGRKEFDWGEAPAGRPTPDEGLVDWASGILRQPSDRPFFLAVGLYKPHIPWYAPKDFLDLIDEKDVQMPENPPAAMAKLHPGYDSSIFRDPIEKKGLVRSAIRGYLATIAYADHLTGRIIEALRSGPHAGTTHVVLWSDNGHHLGEKRQWGKQTLWEQSTRVPMIIVPAGGRAGQRVEQSVSTIDLMRTLCAMSGITPPAGVDGHDLSPLLDAPETPWRYPAVSTRGAESVSLRYGPYRYTRYAPGAVELFDHRDDPGEWNNRADDPAYAPVSRQFAALLPKHFAEPTTGPLETRFRRRWNNYTDWLGTALSFSDPCDI